MATVLYTATMSLDGFITGAGGDMSWLTPHIGPNPAVEELIPNIGALLVGRRTYDGDDPHRGTEVEGEPFGGGWSGPQFVVTRRPPAAAKPGITFGDLPSALEQAKAAAGDRYVAVLGAQIAAQCLALGALDEIFVCVAPVLLGAGVRLFEQPGGRTVGLERIAVSHAPLATNVWLRVRR